MKSESERRSDVSDFVTPWTVYSPWNSPGQNTGVGSLSLLQGIFPSQESNRGLRTCRQILYQLNYQGNHKKDLGFRPKSIEGQTILSQPIFTSLQLTV